MTEGVLVRVGLADQSAVDATSAHAERVRMAKRVVKTCSRMRFELGSSSEFEHGKC